MLRIEKLHLKAWFAFVAAFSILHFSYCVFTIIREMILPDGGHGLLGFIFVFMPSGPFAGLEFAAGYAVCDLIVGASRRSSFRGALVRAHAPAFYRTLCCGW